MKSSFENICFLYKEIHDNIISSDFQIQKIRQWYKCFLDEINKLKNVIEKLLANKSRYSPYKKQPINNPPDSINVKEIYITIPQKKINFK